MTATGQKNCIITNCMLISNFFVLLLNFKTKSTFIWLLIHAFVYLNLRLVGGISCCILIDALSFWYSHSVTTCQNSMKIKQSKINCASKLIPRFVPAESIILQPMSMLCDMKDEIHSSLTPVRQILSPVWSTMSRQWPGRMLS